MNKHNQVHRAVRTNTPDKVNHHKPGQGTHNKTLTGQEIGVHNNNKHNKHNKHHQLLNNKHNHHIKHTRQRGPVARGKIPGNKTPGGSPPVGDEVDIQSRDALHFAKPP